jgi:hypothetical protein
MMIKKTDPLSIEQLWDDLLSRQPDQIDSMFNHLNQSERRKVIEHLNRMLTEEGWHPEQKKSAVIALQRIEKFTEGKKQK